MLSCAAHLTSSSSGSRKTRHAARVQAGLQARPVKRPVCPARQPLPARGRERTNRNFQRQRCTTTTPAPARPLQGHTRRRLGPGGFVYSAATTTTTTTAMQLPADCAHVRVCVPVTQLTKVQAHAPAKPSVDVNVVAKPRSSRCVSNTPLSREKTRQRTRTSRTHRTQQGRQAPAQLPMHTGNNKSNHTLSPLFACEQPCGQQSG